MKSNRNWLIGGSALALVVVLASYFFLVKPKSSDTSDVKAQTSAVDQQNTQLRADLAALNSQKLQLTAKQASIAAVGKEVPDDPETAGLLRTLRRAADTDNVVVTSITPTVPTAVTPLFPQSAAYASIDLAIVVQGDYSSLKLFLNDIEQEQRVIVPVTVNITPNGGATGSTADPSTLTRALTMNLTAKTYTTSTAVTSPSPLPQLAVTSAAPTATPSP